MYTIVSHHVILLFNLLLTRRDYSYISYGMGNYVTEYKSQQGRFRELLEAAQDDLLQFMKERTFIEQRMAQLQHDIVHLAALCNVQVEDPLLQLGFTDLVRYVMANANQEMSIAEIADTMKIVNPEVAAKSNLVANVQTIIRRLAGSGEVRPLGAKFAWGGGPPPIAPPPGWLKEKIEKEMRATRVPPPIRREVN